MFGLGVVFLGWRAVLEFEASDFGLADLGLSRSESFFVASVRRLELRARDVNIAILFYSLLLL